MDAAMAEQVRRFNRVVTQRIGALDDHYLSRDRPLGEARLLWEIGPDGTDTRSLRQRLGLDSGYLSGLLRALEAGGLAWSGSASGTVGSARFSSPTLAGRSGPCSTAGATSSPSRCSSRSATPNALGWWRPCTTSNAC